MKILNKIKFLALLLIILMQFIFVPPSQKAYAATSPTLVESSSYSVIGGAGVTNANATTTSGNVGVSPGSSITGFPPGIAGGDNATHKFIPPDSDAAQADALSAFGALNQDCDFPAYQFGGGLKQLGGANLVPGTYCADSFGLTGTLTLSGSGVWIFKTTTTLVTAPGSSVVGGDPCNVWWRIGSSTTLDTTTSFIGTVISQNGVNAMNTGATLNGRFFALSAGTVTLDSNTISGPTCAAATPTPTPTPTSSSTSTTTSSSNGSSVSAPAAKVCPAFNCVTPVIIESRRVDADSIFISWGPYAGMDTFIVQYGLENGNWLYNTNVTGFSTTINDLPPNQPIWVMVLPTDNCSIGPCGEAKLVGGPSLPNTGFAPRGNRIPWYIPAGIFVGISLLPVLIQRKHRCLSRH